MRFRTTWRQWRFGSRPRARADPFRRRFELTLGSATYADCFKGNMRARTFCGILVQMFQQLTGVNFIFCPFVSLIARAFV